MPRDHIREFYEKGGYIKPREDRTTAALKRVRQPFDGGGPVPATLIGAGKKAAQLFKNYADPAASKIADWAWRPLQDVAKLFPDGLPKAVPEHVLEYGDFMRRMREKAPDQGLDPRDALKAYTTTLSSIQRQARDRDLFPDMTFSSSDRLIRPEGAFSDWLGTKAGQRYLERGSIGEADPEAIADMAKRLNSFGLMPSLSARMAEAPELIAKHAPSGWSGMMHELPGIDAAKKGFMGSMLGHGDRPTFDARQIALHTLPDPNPRIVQNMTRRGGGQGGEEAVERLAARQNAFNMFLPPEYRPDYQHLAHHTVWDAANQTTTPHTDIMDMMENRAEGGRIGYDIGGPTLAGLTGAARKAGKFAGDVAEAAKPAFENLVDRTSRLTGYARDEVVRMLERTKEGVKGATETKPGISSRMGTAPFEGSTAAYTDAPYSPIIKRTLTPESFPEGSYVVGSMVDNTAAGPTVHGVDNVRFDKPVQLTGGNDFPYTQPPGQLWAAAPGPLTGLSSALRSAGATPDDPVFFTTKLMNPGGSDQSHMSMSMIEQMLRNAQMSKDDVAAFNDYLRQYKSSVKMLDPATGKMKSQNVPVFPDFPGLEAKGLHDYFMSLPMIKRAPLLQAMDTKYAQDLNVPSSVSARFAASDPALLGKPRGTVGRTVGGFDLGTDLVTNPEYPHGSYPVNLPGTLIGGFDRPVPGDLLFRDRWDLLRSKYRPQDQMNTFMNLPAVQKVTPEWLDKSMKDYEKIQRGWTPSGLAEGGSVGYADGGEVTPAIGVEGIKGLIKLIQKASGIKQARRFEDAADVANLKPYNEQALLDTFSRPTSMYGAVKPSEFERYAYPLDPNYAQITPKAPGEKAWYAAEGSKPDLGIQSYDDYLKHLQDIAQGRGFNSVPELSIGYRGRGETPIVTTHDGRHRMRALRGENEQPSLVEFKPDSTSYRGVTVPSLSRVLQNGWVIPQNNVSKFDTVPLPDELFAFGGRV